MKDYFLEDVFDHSLSAILHDDVLEEFVGKGCGRMKDGVVNGIGM